MYVAVAAIRVAQHKRTHAVRVAQHNIITNMIMYYGGSRNAANNYFKTCLKTCLNLSSILFQRIRVRRRARPGSTCREVPYVQVEPAMASGGALRLTRKRGYL